MRTLKLPAVVLLAFARQAVALPVFVLVFVLVLPGVALAMSEEPVVVPAEQAVEAAVETPATPVPLLWKISDTDNSIYLLGSFHLLQAGDYPLSPDVEEAFQNAGKLAFEVPVEQVNDPANATKFLQAAGYADGRNLGAVLSPETHAKLAVMLEQAGMPVATFDHFEPWFVNLSLILGMAQPLGLSGELGLDQHFMKRAQAAGKPSIGLETIDRQLEVLDGMPMDEQVAGLTDLVNDPEAMSGQLVRLHQAWRDGDIVTLESVAIDEMKTSTPESYRMVNVERNAAWQPQLQAMLDGSDDDVLVVVGAMHLLGDDGLVEAMRAAGYEVERICSACEADEVD